MKEQIIKHYNSANLQQIQEGLTWYERAHNEAILLSQVFELPLTKVVGVLAALSPNNKWERNLIDAWNLLDKPCLTTKCCTFTKQRQKALDILGGNDSEERILGILNGTKTQNFFKNILHYKTSNTVTVDMWAFRSVKMEPKKKNYDPVAAAYKDAAVELKLRPHQLQAVVWGVVRGGVA